MGGNPGGRGGPLGPGPRAYSLDLNPQAWRFDAAHNVCWPIGLVYAETPATVAYESLGIYVPAASLSAKPNGDGTDTATIDPQGSAAGFRASTAELPGGATGDAREYLPYLNRIGASMTLKDHSDEVGRPPRAPSAWRQRWGLVP